MLPGTNVSLGNPYVIFYPSQQQDLPTNACLTQVASETNGLQLCHRWAGTILVAKYSDIPFGDMIPCIMNDIPIILHHIAQSNPLQSDMVRLADNIHNQKWLLIICVLKVLGYSIYKSIIHDPPVGEMRSFFHNRVIIHLC